MDCDLDRRALTDISEMDVKLNIFCILCVFFFLFFFFCPSSDLAGLWPFTLRPVYGFMCFSLLFKALKIFPDSVNPPLYLSSFRYFFLTDFHIVFSPFGWLSLSTKRTLRHLKTSTVSGSLNIALRSAFVFR